ncbi:hypothetical protein Pcinc_016431 [Petrolisthes cinctipes]|uniref:Mutator-like transposase domain-containing protein n=1 Tax=Petrolisthes cinctipes TaxID=88211 RepID=A0AAE1FTQ9_PETCI|nr:hypothetical protein Pcinc_016431 [Petrolisthes cinctipes]
MEPEAAVRLWGRSVAMKKMKYVTFIGDGDSAAFKAVTGMNDGHGAYDDVSVVKEECLNHVSKRLGTRLRTLKAKSTLVPGGKGRKRSLLGGRGKLTDAVIEKLPFYYGQAVKRNVGGST